MMTRTAGASAFRAQIENRRSHRAKPLIIPTKANDAGIAQTIVEAKTELEKIRE